MLIEFIHQQHASTKRYWQGLRSIATRGEVLPTMNLENRQRNKFLRAKLENIIEALC
jgi:hypothetical protein